MPIIVGRVEELKRLENALHTVRAGAGRCVLLSGEAGIGKSRLIAEVRTRASGNGFTILAGSCFEQERLFPYAPLIDMLRSFFAHGANLDLLEKLGAHSAQIIKLLPELASQIHTTGSSSPLDPDLEKLQLFEALTSLFLRQAEAGPMLMVIEDLHWSDEASLDFLLYLIRRIGSHPILLILSHRHGDAQAGLVRLLTESDREPIAQEIRLEPLSRAEVSELLSAILNQPEGPSAEFVDAIFSLTEGNPFFTEEICTALISSGDIYYSHDHWRRKHLSQIELPDSVQRSVALRLDRISQPAREVINLAAVSGRSFDFDVLKIFTGLSDSELLRLVKELMAAQLVVEESADQFAFRHALTREALYSRLLARERQTLHGQVLSAIEQIHAGSFEAHLEALAYHAYEAALWHKALDYAQRAGNKALALFAPHAAVEHFSRAINAAQRLSQAPISVLYKLRGQAYDTLGNFDQAREDYEMALSVTLAAGDQQEAWQILLDLGLLWASRDYERTGDYCQQALESAQAINDPMAIGHCLNRLGNWLMNSGRLMEALDDHRQALALFEKLGDRAGIAATLDLLAMTSNMCGDASGTVSYYQRAIPILRQLNDRQTLASSLTMLSNYTLDEGLAREAIEIARAIDWRAGEAYALVYLGSLLAYRGNYGQGLRAALSGLELARTIEHHLWQSWGHIVLGLIYFEVLALEEAYRHLHKGRAIAIDVGSSFMITFSTGLLASTCIQLDRLDEAGELLPALLPEKAGAADYSLMKAILELRLIHQEPEQVLQSLDQLVLLDQFEHLGGMAYYAGLFLQLRSEALARLGRLEEAEAEARKALELYQGQGVRMGLWRIQLALGKLYQTEGDLQRAETAFKATRTTIEELAATISDDDQRENFYHRAIGTIPARRTLSPGRAAKAEFGGLTQRERQVAALVVQGLSNQGIADELVVSLKTVEAHITHILSRLGFSSRAQIAAWAVDKGLASAPQDLDSLSAQG